MALLINCSAGEALTIRERAKSEHRGISSYMLNIVMRSVDFQERPWAKAVMLCALMNGCCLLSRTAYDQGRSIRHYAFISHDIRTLKDLANPETAGYRLT